MLSHVEKILKLPIILTIEASTLLNDAMLILNEFKTSIKIGTYDQNINCNMVHNAMKVRISSCWYFDNAC